MFKSSIVWGILTRHVLGFFKGRFDGGGHLYCGVLRLLIGGVPLKHFLSDVFAELGGDDTDKNAADIVPW